MSAGEQNPKIIVSYRRTDSAMAGRIFDRLVQRFGKKSLFIDIDNIPFGGDFRKHIDDALKSSDLLIAMVGPKWVGGEGKDVRITRESDPVRVEIETALKQDVPILPVVLDEARMPDPSDLPESIRDFAYRNAAEVESGRDFDVHVDRLIKAIEQILGAKAGAPAAFASEKSGLVSPSTPTPKTKRFPMPLILGGALVALAGIAAAIWFARDRLAVAEKIDPTTGTAYCEDLKQVVAEARNEFNALMGKQVNDSVWTARLRLPGWENCTVADWTNQGKIIRYYGCQLASVPTAEAMRAQRDTAVAYMQSCLGEEWTKTPVANETNFELGWNDPIARIRETSYTDGRGNILRLEVDVPARLIRNAPPESASEQPKPAPSDQAQAYCDDLKRVITASRTNFAEILGPEFGDKAWKSRVQLPGWDECTIRTLTSTGRLKRYFTCGIGPFSSLELVRAKRDVGAAYVKSCIGPDWTERSSGDPNQTTQLRYFKGSDDPELLLRETHYEDVNEWYFRIDVEAPASQATPVEPEEPQPSGQANAYCDDLKRAVAESRDNFSATLGEGSEEKGWTARLQLPGWQECTVQNWKTQGKTIRYFTCLRGPYPSLEALRAAREEADAYVTPCLGSGWSVRRPENPDKTIRTIYSMGPDDPEVTLREAFSETSKKWWFRIDVDAPASLATPAPPEPAPAPDPPQSPPQASDQPLTAPPAVPQPLAQPQLNPEPSVNPPPPPAN